jgi:hypothetical protein
MKTLTPAQEIDFHQRLGMVFVLNMVFDYSPAMIGLYSQLKNKYAKGKFEDIEKACRILVKQLEKDITAITDTDVERRMILDAIGYQKNMIYNLLMLTPAQQKRVGNLVKKLNKENE